MRTSIESRSSQDPKPIRLAIRGAGGLLGHRLLHTILSTQRDMVVQCVILGTDDLSFTRLRSVLAEFSAPKTDPIKIFVSATGQKIQELMERWDSPWPLEPLNQGHGAINNTDAIIDTAIIQGRDPLTTVYEENGQRKPIVFQSGTYPHHQLITPPFGEPVKAKAMQSYRQGDCILSGVAPALFGIREHIKHLDLRFNVQKQRPSSGHSTRDDLDAFCMDSEIQDRSLAQLASLFPKLSPKNFDVSVIEAPGHDYYFCEVRAVLNKSMTREEFLACVREQPRVAIIPEYIPMDTGQVKKYLLDPAMYSGKKLPPVLVFSGPGAIQTRGRKLIFRVAIYSKMIAVLPNIDSVRALVRRIPFIEAMRQTDDYYFT